MNESNDAYAVAITTPALPNHHATHSLLSEVQDALPVGTTVTVELAAWIDAKLTEAKSHL